MFFTNRIEHIEKLNIICPYIIFTPLPQLAKNMTQREYYCAETQRNALSTNKFVFMDNSGHVPCNNAYDK